jgi:site-specific recombinase XerD
MVDPSRVRVTGPLVPYVDGFWAELAGAGYTAWSVEAQLRLLAHVSRWLAVQGLDAADLTSEAVEEFLRARRGEGYVDRLSPRGLVPLLGYLRGLDVVPAASTLVTPVEQLVQDYCGYLVRERGLAAGSVDRHEEIARRFLSEREEPIREALGGLSAAEITAFVLRESTRRSESSTRTVINGLRSLLRYLHVEGWTPIALTQAVPSVARRQHSLPRSLKAGHVEGLLESCDRASALGVRDYAILTLLARLGLRVAEVTRLRLDDVDWSAGELLVRGKGNRLERLPLPRDVGEALVDYLRRGRPRRPCPELFLRFLAPNVGLSGNGITSLVYAACDRAGRPRLGPHRLRHGLACDLLRHGAPLGEVGQVLRHKSLLATSIYAKVDRVALSGLALPWPEARS